MNDRFKFKFYSSSFKKIFDVIQINISTLTITIADENKCPLCFNLSDGVLMQCTGLKDKNGKLIYEGDILKIKDFNIPVAVKYGAIGFYLYAEPTNTAGYHNDKYIPEDCEVIGNIYETPELLKECE